MGPKSSLKLGVFVYLLSLWTGVGISSNRIGDVITFFSIVVGFFLSGLAILYASPLRQILMSKMQPNNNTLWNNTVNQYRFMTYYSLFIIFLLLIKIPDVKMLTLKIFGKSIFDMESFTLAVVLVGVVIFVKLAETLFKNLKFSVND
ncbi:MAG: hypothetical protein ACLT1C_00610 [Weissella confusa]|uniref:hypothetical protein n=1 Tax=Weissella confusa TaxID=1583 RepID=UPI001C0F5DC6|nr:hypothetical protein [Weissella confusa]MBU5285774.1 hypothetical protein [Weissella confusa]MCS9989739.1 hypothetical protein [Weissella confusa]MCT0009064.1 hypothetical protein [Weissella confusa]MCT0024916.1 hypothetical protein [Weissella confusa]MDY2529150.1 hypothetical protein [Weissella confusa]